jgi:hypothetical protein
VHDFCAWHEECPCAWHEECCRYPVCINRRSRNASRRTTETRSHRSRATLAAQDDASSRDRAAEAGNDATPSDRREDRRGNGHADRRQHAAPQTRKMPTVLKAAALVVVAAGGFYLLSEGLREPPMLERRLIGGLDGYRLETGRPTPPAARNAERQLRAGRRRRARAGIAAPCGVSRNLEGCGSAHRPHVRRTPVATRMPLRSSSRPGWSRTTCSPPAL